jgi:hypothetical protein
MIAPKRQVVSGAGADRLAAGVSTGGTINWLIKSAARALHQSM